MDRFLLSRRATLLGAGASAGCATAGQARLEEIDTVFSDVETTGPGYAIGVSRNGELLHLAGYGLADVEHEAAITPDTSFHVASLSKQFTGAAIALSVIDGKVDLDQPASEFFTQLRRFAPTLTLAHLAYMTSGLPDYFTLPRASGLPWFSLYRFTVAEAIETVLDAGRLDFQPGTQWRYSNINYMMLAEIVAVVQRQSFSSFVAERIFAPLGMAHSVVDDNAMTPIRKCAVGYAPRTAETVAQLASVNVEATGSGPWLKMQRVSPHYGGGGVFSSAADWMLWDRNWSTLQIGGEAFYELMHARRRFEHSKDNDALGLVFGEHDGAPMIWYEGADIDSSSFVARFPNDRLSVWCFSNNPLGEARQRALRVAIRMRAQ